MSYRDIEVSKELPQRGVTRLGEDTKIFIEFQSQAHNGQEVTRMVMFDLKPEGCFVSIEDFDKKARGGWRANRRIPLLNDVIEKTRVVLANSTYYPQAFEDCERDTVTKEQLEEPGQLAEL